LMTMAGRRPSRIIARTSATRHLHRTATSRGVKQVPRESVGFMPAHYAGEKMSLTSARRARHVFGECSAIPPHLCKDAVGKSFLAVCKGKSNICISLTRVLRVVTQSEKVGDSRGHFWQRALGGRRG